jgi:hypothetical protein
MNSKLHSHLHRADEMTRRAFVASTARALLGVGLLPRISGARAQAATATAKRVIYLYMTGGMSHLDTLDPKEGVATAGPVKPIKTSADGVRLSEYLPLTARQMHHASLVRSLASTQGAHEQGIYYMHTSYTLRGTIKHPGLGAWLQVLQGGGHPSLPNYVFIGNESRHPGAGFLPAVNAPLFVNNPENGLKNVQRQRGLAEDRFAARMALASEFDRDFRAAFPQRGVKAFAEMYDAAMTMMKSEDLKAFNLAEETPAMRAAYGKEPFGQGCLLARRLVERGVRFVEVSLSGWDTHTGNFVRTPELCQTLDRALATLLDDLHTRGLLGDTLVVLASEFGRTPEINQNGGRDHYPQAFSALVAGGGMKGGFVFGRTDKEGREIEEGEVKIPDFNATIAQALGLPLDKKIMSPSDRPFTVADKGVPLTALFA